MNYRRNEDRWPIWEGLAYNAVLEVAFTAEGAESVTLAEAKTHMKIDFSDDDAYITVLIKQTRRQLEKERNLSLVSRTVTAVLKNELGDISLPYGPVTAFTSMANIDGEAIISDNYKLRGEAFKYIEDPIIEYVKVVYTAGYTSATIPDDIKLDLLERITYNYRHRGDEKMKKKHTAWLL